MLRDYAKLAVRPGDWKLNYLLASRNLRRKRRICKTRERKRQDQKLDESYRFAHLPSLHGNLNLAVRRHHAILTTLNRSESLEPSIWRPTYRSLQAAQLSVKRCFRMTTSLCGGSSARPVMKLTRPVPI